MRWGLGRHDNTIIMLWKTLQYILLVSYHCQRCLRMSKIYQSVCSFDPSFDALSHVAFGTSNLHFPIGRRHSLAIVTGLLNGLLFSTSKHHMPMQM